MKNQLWSIIYELFYEVRELQGKSQSVVAAREVPKKLVRGIQAEDIVKVRAAIRAKLDFFKTRLAQSLTERETYLVLFPIVIYFDEMIQMSIIKAKAIDWPLLQKELFEITNGGEMFYEVLDDILRKQETLPFIYEVFYLCLNDGFEGKFRDNALKINEYKNKLSSKIPVPQTVTQEVAGDSRNFFDLGKFPIWYYVTTGLFLAFVYLTFTLLAIYIV